MPRKELLYEMALWEIHAIMRGYQSRSREMWSAARWQTFHLMAGYVDLRKAGILRPADLLHLPWDDAARPDLPDESEIEMLRRMVRQERAATPSAG